MAYLVAHRPIAFGTYVSPRRMPPPAPRRGVRFAGTYGLGALDPAAMAATCQQKGAAIPFPALRAKWIQACETALQSQASNLVSAGWTPPAAISTPATPPAPVAQPIVTTTPAAINDPSVAGTPVPPGFPHNNVYVDSTGNQWMYNATTGLWQNATAAATAAATTAEQAQAAQIAAATATTPQGAPAPILVSSPTVSPSLPLPSSSYGAPAPVSVSVSTPTSSTYGDILNFLTESTLISPLPNWVVGAGVVLLVMKFGGKGHLL